MSYFKMHRGWQDSDCFNGEAYSDRDAWVWMIGEAQWRDGIVNVLGVPTALKRAQFSHSIRFMAEKFKWSKDRASRFLKKLERWGMIESETATGQTIITICNYEKYQGGEDTPKDTSKDTGKDAPKDSGKDKEEESKEYKERKEIEARADALGLQEIWPAFESHRKKLKKPMEHKARQLVLSKLEKFKEQGFSPHDLLCEAIEKGWLTVYEPRKNNETTKSNNNGSNGKSRAVREVIADEYAQSYGPSDGSDTGRLTLAKL